jgi:hypothetical protein
MQYKVIDEMFLNDLEKKVNEHIKSGWKLQGGISVSRARYSGHNDELRYFQALIKE